MLLLRNNVTIWALIKGALVQMCNSAEGNRILLWALPPELCSVEQGWTPGSISALGLGTARAACAELIHR